MVAPLMPRATAIWLLENTKLTFEQIADFCDLHELEVKGIADGDVARSILPVSPIANNQLTKEEITRCEKDPNARLKMIESMAQTIITERTKKKGNYVPIAKRQDKPSAILWLLKNFPEMSIRQIAKLVSSTKGTIEAIRDKTYWNSANIRPKDPVLLGLCSQSELNDIYELYKKKEGAHHNTNVETKSADEGIDHDKDIKSPKNKIKFAPIIEQIKESKKNEISSTLKKEGSKKNKINGKGKGDKSNVQITRKSQKLKKRKAH